MSQYSIKYGPARETKEKFTSIKRALEESADLLKRMSRDRQEGLENEADNMGGWSGVIQARSEDVGKVSDTLQSVLDAYENAEKSTHSSLTGLMSAARARAIAKALANATARRRIPPGLRRNRPSTGRILRLIRRWNNGRRSRLRLTPGNRATLPNVRERLPYFRNPILRPPLSILPIFILPGKFLPGLLAPGQQDSGGGAAGSGSGVGNVTEGAGVSALPGGSFAGAQAGVRTDTGRGETAIEGTDTGQISEPDYVARSVTAGAAATEPITETSAGAAATEPITDTSDAKTFSGSAFPDLSSASPLDMLVQSKPVETVPELKTGIGMAAPVIGVAAAGSIAASGVGLHNLSESRNAASGGTVETDPPVIQAKEATGNFSGNLKGEYVLLASGLSLAFAGASLKAGIGSKKNVTKPDDRFRIGYGESAVLSGGPIQERS